MPKCAGVVCQRVQASWSMRKSSRSYGDNDTGLPHGGQHVLRIARTVALLADRGDGGMAAREEFLCDLLLRIVIQIKVGHCASCRHVVRFDAGVNHRSMPIVIRHRSPYRFDQDAVLVGRSPDHRIIEETVVIPRSSIRGGGSLH